MSSGSSLLLPLSAQTASGVLLAGYCWYSGGRLAILPFEYLPLAACYTFTFGQAGLLGIWAALSGQSWRLKLTGLVAGLAYVEALSACALPIMPMPTATLVTVITAAGLLALARRGGFKLRKVAEVTSGTARDSIRFTTRGLMQFALAIGVSLGAARVVREGYTGPGWNMVLAVYWGTLLALQTLAACWSCLSMARAWPRVAGVMFVTPALGFLFAYGIQSEEDIVDMICITIIHVLQYVMLVVWLLAVRSRGYRLVGGSAATVPPATGPIELRPEPAGRS